MTDAAPLSIVVFGVLAVLFILVSYFILRDPARQRGVGRGYLPTDDVGAIDLSYASQDYGGAAGQSGAGDPGGGYDSGTSGGSDPGGNYDSSASSSSDPGGGWDSGAGSSDPGGSYDNTPSGSDGS